MELQLELVPEVHPEEVPEMQFTGIFSLQWVTEVALEMQLE